MATLFHPASVSQDQLDTIQSLEQDLGKVVVALEPEKSEFAKLSTTELAHLQSVEKKLGVVIVAFDT